MQLIMTYAPVLIPTLNRVEHLKRCLKSLEQNSIAEKTEVYISVDFPPHEKYKEGYLKVKKFLGEKHLRFKEVHIYYQEKNLGPGSNIEFLKDIVRDKCDRYIMTEDDNEFSHNFLEYVNKGLDLFEQDDLVIGICGCRDTEWRDNGSNVVKSKLFAPYGFGTWFRKVAMYEKDGESFLLDKATMCPKKMMRLFKRNPLLFSLYISNMLCSNTGLFWNSNGHIQWTDSAKSIYMHLTEHTCIVPQSGKSRTWGNDGSGLNMKKIEGLNPEEKWKLDTAYNFEYNINEPFEFDTQNYKIGKEYLRIKGMSRSVMSALVKYALLMFCGYDRQKVIKIIDKIH